MSTASSATPHPDQQVTTVEKLSKLPWSIAFEASNTVFVQFVYWGTPFVLFLNELDFSNSQVGFLYSIFPFFGLTALFVAPTIARIGYKRTYLFFYRSRNFVTLLFLFVPWLHFHYDGRYTFPVVITIVMLFALCRATAETAIYPWIQEYIPNEVRGKYSATSSVVTSIVGVIAVTIAGFVVESSTSINRFMVLITAGVMAGLLAAFFVSHVPGGAAVTVSDDQPRPGFRQTLSVLKDPNFRLYLLGLGAATAARAPQSAFVSLFMKREVGLEEGQVVILQNGVLVGGLLSTFFWGWMADRYGSKPIILSGLYLYLLLMTGWIFMPRGEFAFIAALVLAFLQGVASMAWVIGAGRLLYVRVVPPTHKTQYMAVYYAVLGLFGGISQLLIGRFLDMMDGLHGTAGIIELTPFTPLFAICFGLAIVSILLFNRVSADNDFSIGQFVGMFMRGNPVSALTSVARYYRAKNEESLIVATEKLGKTNSLLAINELLDALQDPRFNVRFEAIIAMARMQPDERIIDALTQVINGTELALTGPALWALGRIGGESSIEAIRPLLDSDYRSLRAHAARSLGTLKDDAKAEELLDRLQTEQNPGLNMAFAYALGKMGWEPAIPAVIELLENSTNDGARMELALSLSRIIGDEGNFVQLLRKERSDMGTASAQVLIPLRKKLVGREQLLDELNVAIDGFAEVQIDAGAKALGRLLSDLPADEIAEPIRPIIEMCATSLSAEGGKHHEFIVLGVYLLTAILGNGNGKPDTSPAE